MKGVKKRISDTGYDHFFTLVKGILYPTFFIILMQVNFLGKICRSFF